MIGKLLVNLHHAIGEGQKIADALSPLVIGRRREAGEPPRRRKLPGGKLVAVANLADRAKITAKLIREGHEHPIVVQTARMIVSTKCGEGSKGWCVREHDKRGELEAIHAWIRGEGVRYVSDPVNRDTFGSAASTLWTKGGDCANAIIVEGSLAGAVGIPIQLEVIHEVGEKPENLHILGRALLSKIGAGDDVAIDPTVDKPFGWDPVKELAIDFHRVYPVFS